MSNIQVKDGAGVTKYLKATGAGTDVDPHVPEQTVAGPLTDTELRASAVAVSLSSVPLPTGAATAARQDAGNTSLATLAGAVAGTEVQVDVATVALPASLYNGKTTVTTAGTRVALASSQSIVSGVTIKALAANAGMIYVGNSSVTAANGFALAAGEQVFLEIANLVTVYIDSSINGESVTYVAS